MNMAGTKRSAEARGEKPQKRLAVTSKENRMSIGKGQVEENGSSHANLTSRKSEPNLGQKGRTGYDVGNAQDVQKRGDQKSFSGVKSTRKWHSESTNGTSSHDSHVKQRALAQERKASKPNAESIARCKKLWEKLRRKSHVPKGERQKLVTELFDIITGHIQDYVFKHDSVRIIQTALKYANLDQRKSIARELKGEYCKLAEGKYAKFLVAKVLEKGDQDIRNMIITEFYGRVKHLIRHPGGCWILDDTYRTVATDEQRSRMLIEWYGPEYTMFNDIDPSTSLSVILEQHPEKRRPTMQHLHEMINQMVQKKTTGFTMLHDAMLQYFQNTSLGSAERNAFFDMLMDDEEGECYKNLAFTPSGSRLVCLLIASADAKQRRSILRVYKGIINMLAADRFGHRVLLAAYDLIDDTVMTSKAIFVEQLGKDLESVERQQKLFDQAIDLTGRISLLYPLSREKPKWLLLPGDSKIVEEMHQIRASTSKKDSEVRRTELAKPISEVLIPLLSAQTEALVSSSYGCQFIVEVLFGAVVDKTPALNAIATLVREQDEKFDAPLAGRMLKSLVQGGRWNARDKTVDFLEPPLGFDKILFKHIEPEMLLRWATGPRTLVVQALMESRDRETRTAVRNFLDEHREKLKEVDSVATRKLLESLDTADATVIT